MALTAVDVSSYLNCYTRVDWLLLLCGAVCVVNGQQLLRVQPEVVLTTGGQNITITGADLDLLPPPVTLILSLNGSDSTFLSEPCDDTASLGMLVCALPTPLIPLLESNGSRFSVPVNTLFVQIFNDSSKFPLPVFTPPEIFPNANRSFTIWTTRIVNIRGNNLLLDDTLNGTADSFYVIKLGNDLNHQCEIESVAENSITCLLPITHPVIGVDLDLKVVVGAFEYLERRVRYRVPFFEEAGEVYPYNPQARRRTPLRVPGQFLVVGVNESDYSIQIGQGSATELKLQLNFAIFYPPDELPLPLPGFPLHPEVPAYPQLVITVPTRSSSGAPEEARMFYSYQYHVGYVQYPGMAGTGASPGEGNSTDNPRSVSSTTEGTGIGGGTTLGGADESSDDDPPVSIIIVLLVIFGGILFCLLIGCCICSGVCPVGRKAYSGKTVLEDEVSESSEPTQEPTYAIRAYPLYGNNWLSFRRPQETRL